MHILFDIEMAVAVAENRLAGIPAAVSVQIKIRTVDILLAVEDSVVVLVLVGIEFAVAVHVLTVIGDLRPIGIEAKVGAAAGGVVRLLRGPQAADDRKGHGGGSSRRQRSQRAGAKHQHPAAPAGRIGRNAAVCDLVVIPAGMPTAQNLVPTLIVDRHDVLWKIHGRAG